MLLGIRVQKGPSGYHEIGDHNSGVSLQWNLHAYLRKPPRGAKDFFRAVLNDPRVEQLLSEVTETVHQWQENRTDDQTAYRRMMLMHSRRFAEAEADRLCDLGEGPNQGESRRGS